LVKIGRNDSRKLHAVLLASLTIPIFIGTKICQIKVVWGGRGRNGTHVLRLVHYFIKLPPVIEMNWNTVFIRSVIS
jgi:hypothetical protein